MKAASSVGGKALGEGSWFSGWHWVKAAGSVGGTALGEGS